MVQRLTITTRSSEHVTCTVCAVLEVNHAFQRGCNKCMFCLSSPATLPSAFLTETYGNISTRGLDTEKWFFSTVCHRWWESLCNANIISHCVGLALQFALCTKQPGCGVIYQYGEKKTSLGSHWKGCVVGGSCRSACCDWARLDFIDSLVRPLLRTVN